MTLDSEITKKYRWKFVFDPLIINETSQKKIVRTVTR